MKIKLSKLKTIDKNWNQHSIRSNAYNDAAQDKKKIEYIYL